MSDSDEPPPLAGSGSDDSDGPPPLVDTSSDDAPAGAGNAAQASESSEESDGDDYEDFMDIWRQMSMRAAAGPGWNRQRAALGNGRLALQDRAPQTAEALRAAERREAEARERREADERERLRKQAELERERQKRAHRAAMAETYRNIQVRLQSLRENFHALSSHGQQDTNIDENGAFEKDTEVEAHSLNTQAMNGLRGFVVEERDNGRIAVKFPDGSVKSLKRENLKFVKNENNDPIKGLASEIHSCAADAKALVAEASGADDATHTMAGQIAQTECLSLLAGLATPTALADGQQACKIAASLRQSGLQPAKHRKLASQAHAAYAGALLTAGELSDALREAKVATEFSHNVDLGPELVELIKTREARQAETHTIDPAAPKMVEQCFPCEWECGLSFPSTSTKKERHKHRIECCKRHIQCEDCKERGIPFDQYQNHKSQVCSAALLTCDRCDSEIPRKELVSGQHMKQKCPKRHVTCACSWEGPHDELDEHAIRCPMSIIECPSCLDEMPRYAMRNHMCSLVDGSEDCLLCSEPLFVKQPVAIFMKGNKRSCGHYNTCMECAERWMETCYSMEEKRRFERRHNDEAIKPACPSCKAEYDTLTALVEHLVVPPDDPEAFMEELAAKANASKSAPTAKPSKTKKATRRTRQERDAIAGLPSVAPTTPVEVRSRPVAPSASLPRTPVDPSYHSHRPAEFAPTSRVPASRQTQQAAPVQPSAQAAAVSPSSAVGSASAVSPSSAVGSASVSSTPEQVWPDLSAATTSSPDHDAWREKQWSRPVVPALEAKRPLRPKFDGATTPFFQPFFMSPLDIHFAHDTISETFQAPFRGILDTLKELVKGDLTTQEVECIRIVWSEDVDFRKGQGDARWYVAGTYNRRLCMYRLLSIFLPKQWSRVQVYRVPADTVKWTYNNRHKFSTNCRGEHVQVRGRGCVGKSEDSVSWFAAIDMFKRLRNV
eukprot:TRINITY_DN25341_c0_g1_i1.p1 TRINITY_DN25341_c0_g1~~TRINITY_DN25341_c0_g1_i1.p1  ORF type:complete len:954 (-),score=142.69 TRINITY_DN25341_c0_g1_i1:126-2987(-)